MPSVAVVVALTWATAAQADPAPAHPLIAELEEELAERVAPSRCAAVERVDLAGTIDADPVTLGRIAAEVGEREVLPLAIEAGADRSLRRSAARIRRGGDDTVLGELQHHAEQAGLGPEFCELGEPTERQRARCEAADAAARARPRLADGRGLADVAAP